MPFDENSFGGYTGCFLFSRTGRTWPACKTYCESLNGTLLNIETKTEFDCVRDYMSRLPSSDEFFWACFFSSSFNFFFSKLNFYQYFKKNGGKLMDKTGNASFVWKWSNANETEMNSFANL